MLKSDTNYSSRKNPIPFLAITFLLFSCSENPELIQNNNPDKYSLSKDVLWASPDGFDLTMDIYTPTSGKDSYPVIIMFHGGGWLINDNSIMDQSSAYLATHSEYVVCNVNYRLLSDNGNTVRLNQIVEDAFGAVLWVKDNIGSYQGDSSKIAVTGDSAGGHLSAMIVNSGDHLTSLFSYESLGFNPSYLPDGKTAEQVARQGGLEVQAAILSYGAYDLYQAALGGFERLTNPFWLFSGSLARGVFGDDINAADHPEMYKALSPVYNIPSVTERKLPPQLLTVGSDDSLVTPASVKAYVDRLQAEGHTVEYWEHQGRSHAFLDSGSNAVLGISFNADAPPALDVMISFLDEVFY
ncbi:MAG: alpha/beta hydrolase [Gammaproteobacteria bacterium]|nr:alpha/beta hydrolase [Gammaproteobacteria bacterium]